MTPRFEISQGKVLEQYRIVEGLADTVTYSSKTNPLVTRILEEKTDCLFSIHLEQELKNVKDCSRVIFLAQGWTKEQVIRLLAKGIQWFVVDNGTDARVLKEVMEQWEGTVNVLLRWRLKEQSIRTGRYYVFGMRTKEVREWVRIFQESVRKKGKLGIHFHRKTQNMSEWGYRPELEEAFGDILEQIDVVNIGGGIPSQYANTNRNVEQWVLKKIGALRTWLNAHQVDMMVEPGRFIAAPAGRLITTIIGVHGNTLIVDASVYNGDMDALVVPVKLLVEGEQSEGKQYVVKGITPCSMDLFRYKVYLPEKKVGDTLTFINAGAYNFSSDFCSMEPITTEVVA